MGRAGGEWQRGVSGWLVNPERRERRDSADTLTDGQVKELILKIGELERYTRLDAENDRRLRVRDKALVALPWIWPKRGSEYLRLRLSDVMATETELMVTYRLKKKAKRYKVCGEEGCSAKNALASNFCKRCGVRLAEARVETVGQKDRVVTKRKRMDYFFCGFVVDWMRELRAMKAPNSALLFPPFRTSSNAFDLEPERPMSVANFNLILQKLDPSLTSHMFRYGHAEVLFRLGYSAWEVKKAGDWSSDKMPQVYADRKGLTAEDRKFSDDARVL